jgi:hypothetical protein
VTVLSPNGGEVLQTKVRQPLQWAVASGLFDPNKLLKVRFSKDGGKKWKTLYSKKAGKAANAKAWKPGKGDLTAGGLLQVCVYPAAKGAGPICDVNDGAFQIVRKQQ